MRQRHVAPNSLASDRPDALCRAHRHAYRALPGRPRTPRIHRELFRSNPSWMCTDPSSVHALPERGHRALDLG
jgi:hypothetical protein